MSKRFLPRAALLMFAVLAFAPLPARGAVPTECRDDLRDADGYIVRSVTVDARWAPPTLALPIRPGDRFSNAKVQEAMEMVRRALRSERRETFELQNLGSAGVLHVTRCLLVEGRQVDVIIRPRYLRVDLVRVGSNILPIPRTSAPTFYEHVPRPILALNPVVGLYQDEHYGVAPTFGFATNLLALPALLDSGQPLPARREDARLDLVATGRKSLEHEFYDANVHLAFAQMKRSGDAFFQRLALEADYGGKDQPQGEETFSRQAFAFGGSARLKPGNGFIRSVVLGARYRWSDNHFSRGTLRSVDDDTAENAGEVRLLAEGRVAGSFVRAGLWADAASPEERASAYGRIAGIIAIEREFLVAPNQTIGVEAVLGGGRAWGAPPYARFFGGNTDRNFLYDSLDSPAMAAFPNGPWIRSFGEGQAFARSSRRVSSQGATAYWHLNLNVSLPIPALSRPLIPNEEVADGVTLKQLLKNKAGDSVSFYAVQLESEGLSPEAALAKARATYGEVKPAIEFIADRANVFAVKPLLLCDVAGLDAPSTAGGGSVRVALGGGLQVTIVTAKLEVGYMHTVVSERSDRPGNFFARLVFQNLF